jgi:hypothetical protein
MSVCHAPLPPLCIKFGSWLHSLFQQFNSDFKLKGRCKNLQFYGLTETPAKFQTTSFQCQLASAHQKCKEIGGLSPYTCTMKFKIHPSVHGFLYRWQCEILRIKFLSKTFWFTLQVAGVSVRP